MEASNISSSIIEGTHLWGENYKNEINQVILSLTGNRQCAFCLQPESVEKCAIISKINNTCWCVYIELAQALCTWQTFSKLRYTSSIKVFFLSENKHEQAQLIIINIKSKYCGFANVKHWHSLTPKLQFWKKKTSANNCILRLDAYFLTCVLGLLKMS